MSRQYLIKRIILVILLSSFVVPVPLMITDKLSDNLFNKYHWIDNDIQYFVELYSSIYEIDYHLVYALIHSESRGKEKALSYAGAIGLMQVMPFHYEENPTSLFRKERNIYIGIGYLSKCLSRSNGNLVEALKNYNAGPNSKYYNIPYLKEIVNNYLETKNSLPF